MKSFEQQKQHATYGTWKFDATARQLHTIEIDRGYSLERAIKCNPNDRVKEIKSKA